MASPATVGVALADLPGLGGRHIGLSQWHEITQEQVNKFSDATGDHRWIHVDPQRSVWGPGRARLPDAVDCPLLLGGVFLLDGATQVMNYGLGKIRFPASVPVGSKSRMTASCAAVAEVAGGCEATLRLTFTRAGLVKPVCAAEILFHDYGDQGVQR